MRDDHRTVHNMTWLHVRGVMSSSVAAKWFDGVARHELVSLCAR